MIRKNKSRCRPSQDVLYLPHRRLFPLLPVGAIKQRATATPANSSARALLSRATNFVRTTVLGNARTQYSAIHAECSFRSGWVFGKKKRAAGPPATFLLAFKSATHLEISEKIARPAYSVIGVGDVPHLLLLRCLRTAFARRAAAPSPV